MHVHLSIRGWAPVKNEDYATLFIASNVTNVRTNSWHRVGPWKDVLAFGQTAIFAW